MWTSHLVLLLVSVFPPKPDMTLRFQDISMTQALGAARLVGLKADLPIPLEGRVGFLLIEVRGNIVTLHASRILMQGDPIRSINAVYHRRKEEYYVRAEALGGLIELHGVIPKQPKDPNEKPNFFRSLLPR